MPEDDTTYWTWRRIGSYVLASVVLSTAVWYSGYFSKCPDADTFFLNKAKERYRENPAVYGQLQKEQKFFEAYNANEKLYRAVHNEDDPSYNSWLNWWQRKTPGVFGLSKPIGDLIKAKRAEIKKVDDAGYSSDKAKKLVDLNNDISHLRVHMPHDHNETLAKRISKGPRHREKYWKAFTDVKVAARNDGAHITKSAAIGAGCVAGAALLDQVYHAPTNADDDQATGSNNGTLENSGGNDGSPTNQVQRTPAKGPENATNEKKDDPKGMSWGLILFIVVAILLVAGAAVYFFVFMPSEDDELHDEELGELQVIVN